LARGEYQEKDIDSFDPNDAIIYPILIFTDGTLNSRGVNYYLNKRFRLFQEEANINHIDIRPLTLIDIDSLIKFQDLFHENKIALNQCLNYFHDIIQKAQIENKVYTFHGAIHELTSKFRRDTPKMFWDTVKDVIEKKDQN
jgi:hypothetical protein